MLRGLRGPLTSLAFWGARPLLSFNFLTSSFLARGYSRPAVAFGVVPRRARPSCRPSRLNAHRYSASTYTSGLILICQGVSRSDRIKETSHYDKSHPEALRILLCSDLKLCAPGVLELECCHLSVCSIKTHCGVHHGTSLQQFGF